ncbi:MAG: hypothetical protein HYX75_00055 [Acidobacteria bacterium]|nr:hypothetical protein [Acidobacteriota bacterium]
MSRPPLSCFKKGESNLTASRKHRPFPVAVKTGTSKGFRDAWCAAYSDTYIAGVWVWHPDNYLMKKRTGADSAAQLVHRIMETLHPERMDGMSETAFWPAPGFIARRICMLSGKLATEETQHVALEGFRPGTEPVEKSDAYRKIAIDARTGRPALADCPAELVREKTYVALDERFAVWAKQSGLELPPVEMLDTASLPGQSPPLRIAINEPPDGATLLPDPETPADLSTIPLHATVTPASARSSGTSTANPTKSSTTPTPPTGSSPQATTHPSSSSPTPQ